MMSLQDYAMDVDLSVEEVKALCDKVGISYEDENTLLDDISITLLDNTIQEETEDTEERRLEEEVEDKAEELAFDTKIDLDNQTSFTKVKQNKQAKKTENNVLTFESTNIVIYLNMISVICFVIYSLLYKMDYNMQKPPNSLIIWKMFD